MESAERDAVVIKVQDPVNEPLVVGNQKESIDGSDLGDYFMDASGTEVRYFNLNIDVPTSGIYRRPFGLVRLN